MSTSEEYRGKRIVIRFDGARCVHARNCVMQAPTVFRANVVGPWIDPDAMDADELAAVARNCPSGAIQYERVDGAAAEAAPLVNTIRVRENGPLEVRADLHIEGEPARLRATLCRCGQSAHKPYCDGAHATACFAASGEARTQDSAPLAERAGALAITPAPDGPLLVTGPVEILTGTGRTILRTEKCALCRCGQSRNKPYCDGSHRAVGFKT
jgi:CDGSH-type Zn-finger protein/uncharacterized Fe-S cluster protein YjdI